MKIVLISTVYFLITFTLNANDMIDSLKAALVQKDASRIITLIESNPGILDAKDENGSSGFVLIAYSGLKPVFERAIVLKQSFSFHEAIVSGNESVVQEYLNNTGNSLINSYSSDGFTPISLAAFFDQTKIAILLFENGADPDLQATNPSKVNALHSAVTKENFELCKILINAGANVNAEQMQNVTPLHSAAHRGNLNIVQLLVENGAEIDKKMENGDTAPIIAERDGHQDVARYLAKKQKMR